METPCCAHADGHQHGGRKVTETSVIEFLHRNEIIFILELRNIEINTSSRARTV